MGCATKPWEPNPVFRTLAPDAFVAFQEPGYVKIAWTLRADPIGEGGSLFRTETRAIATDPDARRKFRRYWSFLSWDRCYAALMEHTRIRLEEEVKRLGGHYAHVLDEHIESQRDEASGESWLRGRFSYVLYRRTAAERICQR